MEKKVYFQSSLPRSGSTLLQNILGQNPSIYPTSTSGVIDLILGSRIGYNKNEEAKSMDKDLWRSIYYSFCRGGLESISNSITDRSIVIDKSRGWIGYYNLLNEIYPNPRIIVLVRDLRAVFSSMEKKFRSNPDYDDGMLNNTEMKNITTEQRVITWANSHPIGHFLLKLYQSLIDGTSKNFYFLKYEDLCYNPDREIKGIYNFLNIPFFNHNFHNIPQITKEDDTVHGIYGDHIIRNSLDKFPDDFYEILGTYSNEWIYDSFKWYFDTFNYKK